MYLKKVSGHHYKFFFDTSATKHRDELSIPNHVSFDQAEGRRGKTLGNLIAHSILHPNSIMASNI
jgi:hypothetical protein